MKKYFTEKKKKTVLIYIILWILLTIILVLPLSVGAVNASKDGIINTDSFFSTAIDNICNISTRVQAFNSKYIQNTKKALEYYTFFYAVIMLILILKFKDNGNYHDIEHGSSDWCEGGEQYKVLSRNSGIILAEKNYLPVDKQGNVNVLIVGRIWSW